MHLASKGCRHIAAPVVSPTIGRHSVLFAAVVGVSIAALLVIGPAGPAVAAGPAAAHVALGDSYSSGEGTPPFERGTNTRANRCARSLHSWPRLVAQELKVQWRSFACSGGLVDDLTVGRAGASQRERQRPQLARLRATSGVRVVTLTVGGNDVGFKDVLTKCWSPVRCDERYTAQGGDTLTEKVRNLEPRLRAVYRSVRAAAPRARLVVLGYPKLFPAESNRFCPPHVGLRPAEATYLNDKVIELNAAIARSARAARATFVSVADAFAGHEVDCSRAQWVNSLGGGPIRHAFHPKLLGQRRLADRALIALRGSVRRLGPDAFGGARLGASRAQVSRAVGGTLRCLEANCDCVQAAKSAGGATLTFRDGRLRALTAAAGSAIQTTAGIRVGDKEDLVRSAYPGVRRVARSYVIPGRVGVLSITLAGQKVTSMRLSHPGDSTDYDDCV